MGKHAVDYAELRDRINGGGVLRFIWMDDLVKTVNAFTREHIALVNALPELQARAIEAARDAIMPPVNWNLRPDGTERPGTQHMDEALFFIHQDLTRLADEHRSGAQTTTDSKPFCDSCAGPYDGWLTQYGGHWDTCPNRREPSDG